MYKISALESWKYAWEAFKKNWMVLMSAIIAPYLIGVIVNEIAKANPVLKETLKTGGFKNMNLTAYALGLIAVYYVVKYLIAVLFRIGKAQINLDAVDGKKPRFADLFNTKGVFLNFLLASIIFDLCVLGGLIFFIIPGVYVFLTYCFAPYLILDKKMTISEAFTKSKLMTTGRKMSFLWFSIVIAFFVVLGLLGLIVGVLVTFAISEVAFFHLYRKLSEEVNDEPVDENSNDLSGQEKIDFVENAPQKDAEN